MFHACLCKRPVGRLLVCLSFIAMAGCATVMNPYLDTSAAKAKAACVKEQTCTPTERFRAIREAVESTQDRARLSYTERAQINSWTSALAFPLTGALLYGGATRASEGARKGILGWGLAVGAGYEARNALLSGSPEGTYLLADARLACVVDEAYKYNLKQPDANCAARQTALALEISKVQALKPTAEMRVKRDAYLARATGAISQYEQRDQTISAAADHMQAAARKIVSDTNNQIRTASISPATATSLLRSELAIIQPGSKLDPSKSNSPRSGDDSSDQEVARALNDLVDRLTDFAQACIVPQPASPAAFDGCTTYSPAIPPPPTITTSLPGNEFSMSPGATKSLTATSQPTGTPWADFAGDAAAATAALGRPQIVTLTPTQSQITLTYTNAVAKETTVVLSLTTIGVAGNAVPLTITLQPNPAAAAGVAGAAAPADARIDAQAGAKLSALKSDDCLIKILKVGAPPAEDDIKARLDIQWRAAGLGEPTIDKVTADSFISQLKADPKLNPSKCK